MNLNLVCSFDLIPGLVIDLLGTPAIVIDNKRDLEHEVAHVLVNTPAGDQELHLSWAAPDTINVIGVTVDLAPDNIKLFDS